jgi:trehalose 6-phosphate phosphatase
VDLPDPLVPLADEPARSVLVVDFDGSLAPIVHDPTAARPLRSGLTALGLLVPVLADVAVVSGRAVEFLAGVLPVRGLTLVGLYGLERYVDGRTSVDPRAEPFLVPAAAAAAAAEAALPGLYVERKGGLCTTIHFRRAPERADEALSVAEDLGRRFGVDTLRGRSAVELRPPVPIDKGTAVRDLARGSFAAAFAGDDAGDLPAFAALTDLVHAGALVHGVRIGVRSSEAPREILDADVVVDGPGALAELLLALAGEIKRRAR